jgi:hypothetical protein
VFEGADWELTWPKELFVTEATGLLSRSWGAESNWHEQATLLMEEAFAGPAAVDAVKGTGGPGSPDAELVLRQLVQDADALTQAGERRPYFSQRQTGAGPAPLMEEAVRASFEGTVDELYRRGYLDQAFPQGCVDDRDFVHVDPSLVLEERLGRPGLWPLQKSRPEWDQDTFFDLVEVFHDLVARPRSRSWHDWSGCGWHWSGFAREPAQVLYRWRINRLLERGGLAYRLADAGEDRGRLILRSDEARENLVDRMVAVADPAGDRVRHAIAQFRARGAGEHDKRAAVITLAGILEERRKLLKTELLSKDEGALFHIANEFAIRHRGARQQSDYDPVFVSGVVWSYLETIELTDRLATRQTTP